MFRRILTLLLVCTVFVAAADDCPVIPRPRHYRATGEYVTLPEASKMAIVLTVDAHQTVRYAA